MNDNKPDKRISVIGIGNPFRQDDAVGLHVARELKGCVAEVVSVVEKSGEATELMEAMENAEALILVDALQSGMAPGTVHRFDVSTISLPKNCFSCSTHNMGLAESIEMARALDKLPETVIVYGIEGDCFDPGETLSPQVSKAIGETAENILRDIADIQESFKSK